MTKITIFIGCMALFLCGSSMNLLADEVENDINSALSAYKAKKYKQASDHLEFAAQKIRQLKAENIELLFPEPLPGWKAADGKSASVGSMFMSGIISGSKEYQKNDSRVKIAISTDNPMIGIVSAIISNPMMIQVSTQFGNATGQEIIRIRDQKALSEWHPDSAEGSIKFVIDNNALISIEGTDCQKQDIQKYAESMDFNKIKAYVSE